MKAISNPERFKDKSECVAQCFRSIQTLSKNLLVSRDMVSRDPNHNPQT